jgi:hypothetical protein
MLQPGPGAPHSHTLFSSLLPVMNGPIAGLNDFVQISFRPLKKRSSLFIHFTFAPGFNIFVYACREFPLQEKERRRKEKQFTQCT